MNAWRVSVGIPFYLMILIPSDNLYDVFELRKSFVKSSG